MTVTAVPISTAVVMNDAWRIARAAAAKFGGKVRHFFGPALRQAWAAARKPVRQPLSTGRNSIKADLSFNPDVVAGGEITPRIRVVTDYDTTSVLRPIADYRSRSQMSGSLLYQLSENNLYVIYAAYNSSKSCTTIVSTYDGVTVAIGPKTFEREKRRLYPTGFELWKVRREQARVAEEARQARLVEKERERLEKMRAEAARREAEIAERKALLSADADKIAAEGQKVVDGLPLLTGTTRQVAWALRIRSAVQAREPNNPGLRRATTSSYWIEKYRSVLPG